MIVVDIETSGFYADRNGLWQIGAIDLETMEEFVDECRIDDEDEVMEDALRVTGKTEQELRDKNKQSQKELIERFFNWFNSKKVKILVSQNPQIVDFPFLFLKANKYNLETPLHYRVFDLHTLAQIKYFEMKGEFLMHEEKAGVSGMDLSSVMELCGLKDERDTHNALEDAKITAECFSRLVYGKELFSEFNKFKIPEELK